MPDQTYAARLRERTGLSRRWRGLIVLRANEADAIADALEVMASWVGYPQLPSSCEAEMRDALAALDRRAGREEQG